VSPRSDLVLPDPGAARSFWLQEALAADPGDPCPPLEGFVGADVCIVGGGFAGLWTAVELSRREPDLRIALLEQDICGGGASGRNGGFFSSSWWDAPATCGLFGDEALRAEFGQEPEKGTRELYNGILSRQIGPREKTEDTPRGGPEGLEAQLGTLVPVLAAAEREICRYRLDRVALVVERGIGALQVIVDQLAH